MEEREDLNDELIIQHMLASETIDEWNSAREFAKRFRGQKWISQNIDMGLIGQVTFQRNVVLPRTDDDQERVITIEPATRLSRGSIDLRDWYRQQKNQL